MDPVNSLGNIMEVLRRQISDNAQRLDRAGKIGSQRSTATTAKTNTPAPKELRALIQERIKGLSSNEPQYQHKAKRLFLESVMIWEFGSDIARDQRFGEMLQTIQETLESSPDTQQSLDKLLQQLTAS